MSHFLALPHTQANHHPAVIAAPQQLSPFPAALTNPLHGVMKKVSAEAIARSPTEKLPY